MKKYLVVLVVLVVLITLLAPYIKGTTAVTFFSERYGEISFEEWSDAPQKLGARSYTTNYYTQLDKFEKAIYDTRLKNINQFRRGAVGRVDIDLPPSISLTALVNAFFNATFAFDYDHPEVFWMTKTMRLGYFYNEGTNQVTGAFFKKPNSGWYNLAYDTYEQVVNAEAVFDAKVRKIISNAPRGTYSKILYFHDWLVTNNTFNTYVANGKNSQASQLAWSAASALISNPKSTADDPSCEGYSRAFKVLCDAAKIPCAIVSGTAQGAEHMWNAVKLINNMWFSVDVTYDDPISEAPKLSHDYFLKGSLTISETHSEQGVVAGYGRYAFPTLCDYDFQLSAGDKFGDVNDDGLLNTGDAVAVLKYSVGTTALSYIGKFRADFNCDTEVNTGDAVMVLKCAVDFSI